MKLYRDTPEELWIGWRSLVSDGIYAPEDRKNSGNLTQMKGDGETHPASGAPTLLILVRHAEKTAGGPDPNLSPAGQDRAGALAHFSPVMTAAGTGCPISLRSRSIASTPVSSRFSR